MLCVFFENTVIVYQINVPFQISQLITAIIMFTVLSYSIITRWYNYVITYDNDRHDMILHLHMRHDPFPAEWDFFKVNISYHSLPCVHPVRHRPFHNNIQI